MLMIWAESKSLAQERRPDVTQFTIEDLVKMEISSVSRRPEELFNAPAAIYVITSEDIRRSGARFIAEALRMAPGLDVARIDASKWAISARGFNDRFSNKLLVLVDGRTVYTPAFSGVYWDVQDLLLEDIDRIEVVRGPGATLWGANAVNGVINIVTKSSKDTQGVYAEAGGGNVDQGFEGVRYGGKIGENAYVRVYEKYFNHASFFDPSGNAADDWRMARGGFRVDWDASESNLLTLQGDVYRGDAGSKQVVPDLNPPYAQTIQGDAKLRGADVLSRWKHTFADQNETSLQVYYDETRRDDIRHKEKRETFDLDFQHRFPLLNVNEIVYGFGVRLSRDRFDRTASPVYPDPSLVFPDSSRVLDLESAFIQDQIMLVRDRLFLTLGSKVEQNNLTGFEFEPGTRLLWTPQERHAVWASVARAVRTPSRAESNIRADILAFPPGPTNPPIVVQATGNADFRSENLLAYEIGYRVRPADRVSFDLAAFYNDYDYLRTGEPQFQSASPVFGPPPNPPYLLLPDLVENRMKGETYGVELVAHWTPLDSWKLTASYSYLQMQLHLDPGSGDPFSQEAEGRSPHHQAQVRSLLDVTRNLQFDTAVYYVDNLPSLRVPGYIRFDVRLGWRPNRNLEVSLVLQNLLDNHHPEFGNSPENFDVPTEVRRSIYGMVSWRF